MEHGSTVYVVDNDANARQVISAVIHSKGLQAKEFGSTDEFLAEFSPALSGCLVVDVRMAGSSGLKLLEQLKSPPGSLPAIATASGADISLAVKAMQAGAFGFVPKPIHEEELWNALEPALAAEQSQHARRQQLIETQERLASLTADELEVFRRLLAGHANKRIAIDLDIGLRTVELRRANIMRKMQAASLPDLVRLAILGGFLKADAAPPPDESPGS